MAVQFIIDSASDVSVQEAATLGVTLLSMEVTVGDEQYLDGDTLLPKQFYEKLVESDALPKTSQINAFRFEQEYEKIVSAGDEAVVITLSSKLSGTYQSAVLAAEGYRGRVYVFDSLNACIGERLLLLYALRLREEGKSAEEIYAHLMEKRSRVHVMAMLNTLEYLKKGGRISAAAAIAGEMLSIKPVIGVIDGEVKLIGKALGSRKGNNLLNSLVSKTGIDFSMPYGMVWSGIDDFVLQKYLRDSSALWEGKTECVPAYMIGCTIGTHVGPGTIGVAFFEK